jgi:hypothetical protein
MQIFHRCGRPGSNAGSGPVQRRCGIRQSGGRYAWLRTVWYDADAHGAGRSLKRSRGSGSTLQPGHRRPSHILQDAALGPLGQMGCAVKSVAAQGCARGVKGPMGTRSQKLSSGACGKLSLIFAIGKPVVSRPSISKLRLKPVGARLPQSPSCTWGRQVRLGREGASWVRWGPAVR